MLKKLLAATASGLLLASFIGITVHNISAQEAYPPGYYELDELPFVSIELLNESDVALSLTLSTLCNPRLILQPGESVWIKDCFRQGIIYHVHAVFYTYDIVLERNDFLFVARPGQKWKFFKLSKSS